MPGSSVSIVYFEHVIAGWGKIKAEHNKSKSSPKTIEVSDFKKVSSHAEEVM